MKSNQDVTAGKANRCWQWSHQWSKWTVKEYKVAKYSPLQSVTKTVSYNGEAIDLTKLADDERIWVSKNERTCQKCGITKVRGL